MTLARAGGRLGNGRQLVTAGNREVAIGNRERQRPGTARATTTRAMTANSYVERAPSPARETQDEAGSNSRESYSWRQSDCAAKPLPPPAQSLPLPVPCLSAAKPPPVRRDSAALLKKPLPFTRAGAGARFGAELKKPPALPVAVVLSAAHSRKVSSTEVRHDR